MMSDSLASSHTRLQPSSTYQVEAQVHLLDAHDQILQLQVDNTRPAIVVFKPATATPPPPTECKNPSMNVAKEILMNKKKKISASSSSSSPESKSATASEASSTAETATATATAGTATAAFIGRPLNDSQWHRHLRDLQDYKAKHGHANVPFSHTNRGLAQWVKNQRGLHHRGTLSHERAQLLEAMGFQWSISKSKRANPIEPTSVADPVPTRTSLRSESQKQCRSEGGPASTFAIDDQFFAESKTSMLNDWLLEEFEQSAVIPLTLKSFM